MSRTPVVSAVGELGVSGGLGNILINSYPPSEGFSPARSEL